MGRQLESHFSWCAECGSRLASMRRVSPGSAASGGPCRRRCASRSAARCFAEPPVWRPQAPRHARFLLFPCSRGCAPPPPRWGSPWWWGVHFRARGRSFPGLGCGEPRASRPSSRERRSPSSRVTMVSWCPLPGEVAGRDFTLTVDGWVQMGSRGGGAGRPRRHRWPAGAGAADQARVWSFCSPTARRCCCATTLRDGRDPQRAAEPRAGLRGSAGGITIPRCAGWTGSDGRWRRRAGRLPERLDLSDRPAAAEGRRLPACGRGSPWRVGLVGDHVLSGLLSQGPRMVSTCRPRLHAPDQVQLVADADLGEVGAVGLDQPDAGEVAAFKAAAREFRYCGAGARLVLGSSRAGRPSRAPPRSPCGWLGCRPQRICWSAFASTEGARA